MKLLVTTPLSVIVEAGEVRHVRAEDETGAFGIQPGHADFITVLSVSVVTWRNEDDTEHHIAVRGGALTVSGGDSVEIATREAVGEDELSRLGDRVLERYRQAVESEQEARKSSMRLQVAAIRQIQHYLQTGRRTVPQGLPSGRGAPRAQNVAENQ